MVSPLSGSLARTIGSAFSGVFLPATLTRDGVPTGPTYDPTPGVPQTFACKAIVERYSAFQRANGLVEASDRKVLVLAASLATKPKPNDVITVGGIAFTAQAVATDPATAVWEIQGRF